MKINFTKKEYMLLIELLEIGDWVINSRHLAEDKTAHAALVVKVLSHYQQAGAEHMVERSTHQDTYYPTSDFEDYIHQNYIHSYDYQVFWENLADELAKRDAGVDLDDDHQDGRTTTERWDRFDRLIQWYQEEFTEHGLANLYVKQNGDKKIH